MAGTPDEPRTVRCPRCGYDQRGVVATWRESCPLEGTCSECGLRLSWSEVLQPEEYEPTWCVEFAAGGRRVLAACARTFGRSFWPWRFWSRLRMSQQIRWGRLCLYLLFLSLLVAAGYVIEQATVATSVRHLVSQEAVSRAANIQALVNRMEEFVGSPDFEELRPAEQQRQRQYLQTLRQRLNQPYVIHQSYAMAIAEAVFTPLASSSRGSVNAMGRIHPYPAPNSLHWVLGVELPRTIGWVRYDTLKLALLLLCWQVAAMVLLPLGFVCLPVSRRRAKVRWRHVGRIAIYGMFIPATLLLFGAVCLALALAIPDWDRASPWQGIQLIARGGLIGLLVIWWAVAVKRYLCMPHGWAVALLLAVMSSLAILGVAAVVRFDLTLELFMSLFQLLG